MSSFIAKMYICKICNKALHHHRSLFNHTNGAHYAPKFKCDHCNKTFKRSSYLKDHQLKCSNITKDSKTAVEEEAMSKTDITVLKLEVPMAQV
jgi:ribosomal protein L37AE/L43A